MFSHQMPAPKLPKIDPLQDLFHRLSDAWPLISAGYEDVIGLVTVAATWGQGIFFSPAFTLIYSTQWPVWLEAEVYVRAGLSFFVPAEN